MANEKNPGVDPLPTPKAVYGEAVAKALEWLGDRYLLARPINAAPNRATPGAARHSPTP